MRANLTTIKFPQIGYIVNLNITLNFVTCNKFFYTICFLLAIFVFSACSQGDDQREFENAAFSNPTGITATKENGDIIEGQIDPDDWRVAPFYQGLVEVYPPYPNPVMTNDRVRFEIYITGFDAVRGLRVHVLRSLNSLSDYLYREFQNPLPPGMVSMSLNPLEIAHVREDPEGIYRIIVLDQQGNVITYGDVEVE